MLSQSQIAQYLLHADLISAESIVDGNVTIVEASRRNRNFKAISDTGPSYLLKQSASGTNGGTVAHESQVYRFLQSEPRNASFRPHLPRYYHYDEEHGILILELLRDAKDFRDYHTQLGHFPTTVAAELGRGLSALHCLPVTEDQTCPLFANRLPWVLALHRPGLDLFRQVSHANLQLIRIIQNTPDFPQLLDGLRQEWRMNSLVHHDIKWDNCLVSRRAKSTRTSAVTIVDWEFAALGDNCWDAGAIFSNYLSVWLFSIPVSGEEPPDRFLELAKYPLERMQPAIRAYWDAYARGMRLDAADSEAHLLRAVKYAGARLLQTGIEQMQYSTHLSGNVICLLQLSLNIMHRPQEAIVHLLGIPLRP